MEPEIIALARRMHKAWSKAFGWGPTQWCDWNEKTRGAWLAAAIVARPDLADVRVEPGHWAAGILPTREPSVRVGEEPGGWMNGRRVKP